MLWYMKKCHTIDIETDFVHIATRAAFGFKKILRNKANVATWLHNGLSHSQKHFPVKKKLQNRLHTQNKHPTIKDSNPFYFSVAHIFCYIWHLHCLFKFQV